MSIGSKIAFLLLLWPTLAWAHQPNGISGGVGSNGINITRRPFLIIPQTGGSVVSGGPTIPASSLLLHFDGTNGSTSFIDATGRHTVTFAGSPVIDTSQSKFGSASLYTPGDGASRLILDGSSDFNFGTGDFTVDFWARPEASGIIYFYDTAAASNSSNQVFDISYRDASNTPLFEDGPPSIRIYGTAPMAIGTWYHVAATRASGQTQLFLNGIQVGSSAADTNNYISFANRPLIGGSGYFNGGQNANVHIDELRVIKGTAAWTTNFTPPSVPYTQ